MLRNLSKLAYLFVLGVALLCPVKIGQAARASFFGESADATKFVSQAYWFGAAIVGGLALMFIVIAGVNYLRSSGNEEHVTKAKEMLGAALMGLVLVMGSYVILNTLDPRLVDFKIEVVSVKSADPAKDVAGATCVSDQNCSGDYRKAGYCNLTGLGSPEYLNYDIKYTCKNGKCVIPKGNGCGSETACCSIGCGQTASGFILNACESGTTCKESEYCVDDQGTCVLEYNSAVALYTCQ